jgi:hypothetical protein
MRDLSLGPAATGSTTTGVTTLHLDAVTIHALPLSAAEIRFSSSFIDTAGIDTQMLDVDRSVIVRSFPLIERAELTDVVLDGVGDLTCQTCRFIRSALRGVAGVAIGDAEWEFTDAVIEDPGGPNTGAILKGSFSALEATLRMRRVAIRRASPAAVVLAGGRAEIEDAWFEHTAVDRGGFGAGMAVEEASTATLTRVVIDRAAVVGVSLIDGILEARDLTVRNTSPDAETHKFGRALNLQGDSRATLDRLLFQENHEVSMLVFAGTVEANDLRILDTRARPCSAAECEQSFGSAIVVADSSSTLAVDRFALERGPLCGVQLVDEPAIRFHHGTISGFGAGVCAPVFPSAADAFVDVLLSDNASRIATRTLPLPEPLSPVRAL